MKALTILLTVSFLLNIAGIVLADDTEQKGFDIMNKADRTFFPYEGTYDISLTQKDAEGNINEYAMEGYKKGALRQTCVFIKPEVQKNDVGMRDGDVIYYKPHTWPKPRIQSYTALFMSTTFSWGDLMSSDIALDYKTQKLETVDENGTNEYHLTLLPKKENMYARIELWIDSRNYNTYRRLYFTASGDKLKVAEYYDIKVEHGAVSGFKINMRDFIQEVTTSAEIKNLKESKLPSFFFDPQNISRIRAK